MSRGIDRDNNIKDIADKYGLSVKEYKNLNNDKRRSRKWTYCTSRIKEKEGCKICEEDDAVCLEFHHINPVNKDYIISTNDVAISKLLSEMQKCIVVCKNCHAKIEHNHLSTVDLKQKYETINAEKYISIIEKYYKTDRLKNFPPNL